MKSENIFLSFNPAQKAYSVTLFSENSDNRVKDAKGSFGQQIRDIYSLEKLPKMAVSLEFENTFFNRSGMERYLLKAIGDSGGSLSYWNGDYSRLGSKHHATHIVVKNAEPSRIIAAIVAAVKDNSAALGKDGIMFDAKEIEQIPVIKDYIDKYLQKKI